MSCGMRSPRRPYDIVAAVLVGGTEKLRGGEDYGVPLAATLEEAVVEHAPEVVLDLSDEPVLGPVERFRLASRALALGVPYVGSDFRFDPPRFEPLALPSLAVIGTGKRVGKTAVTGHVARTLAPGRRVVVVAMGRGGPAEPETIQSPPTLDTLLALARAGRHAASDHLEIAALTGVPTVGCRRCGGGLAGAVAMSNVADGIAAAEALDPDLLVFDGSGAALPPVASARRVLVVGAHQDRAVATGFLNAYRALLADLIVVTMAEADLEHGLLAAELRAIARPGRADRSRHAPPSSDHGRARQARCVLRHGPGRSARPHCRASRRSARGRCRARLGQPRRSCPAA